MVTPSKKYFSINNKDKTCLELKWKGIRTEKHEVTIVKRSIVCADVIFIEKNECIIFYVLCVLLDILNVSKECCYNSIFDSNPQRVCLTAVFTFLPCIYTYFAANSIPPKYTYITLKSRNNFRLFGIQCWFLHCFEPKLSTKCFRCA